MSGRFLTGERFSAARRFIDEQSRPLEAALARCHFDGAPRETVLEELAAFQNADGGFGHALEPDLRAPESSAIATAVAFQVLREVGAAGDAELADRAFGYLRNTFIPERCAWRIVPESAEASPHAPWWNQTGREHDYDTNVVNPTAELLGCLYERPGAFHADVVEGIAATVMQALEQQDELEMHDLLCCLRLHASNGLPDALRARLRELLAGFAERAVVRDPGKWAGYGLRPHQVADGPSSVFWPAFEADVLRDLDNLIAVQQPDGAWPPLWTWGEAYPDVWPTAQREWTGVCTLRNLLVLRRFGRIEDPPAVG